MCTFINTQTTQESLRIQLDSLNTIPGTCIFIDMCNSTELKQRDLKEWVIIIANTIQQVNTLLGQYVIKVIGDELMIYIPDDKLGNENYATIFDFIICLLLDFDYEFCGLTLRLKASIHYCEDVYKITFLRGHNDYYGNGIDLAARLMSKAKENRIILSEEFYRKAFPISPEHFEDVSNKYIENFKGFSSYTEFRILDVTD